MSKVFRGAKLFEWQKAVTDHICNQRGTGKKVVVKAHRQAGKSYMCLNILLYYAINYQHTQNAMISPTLNQSRAMFKELWNAIAESGVVKSKNETLLTIEFINGSTIFFKSGEQKDALRGYHINGVLILDEAAYLTDDILQLVMPWTQVANSPILIVSTPFIKSGFFYKFWLQGLQPVLRNVVSIDWCKYDTSALLTKEQRDEYKRVLPHNQYLTEIEGEFLDGDGMVFTGIKDNVGAPRSNYNMLYAGIDWGTGKESDSTSISIFNEYGEMVFIDYFNNLGTYPQIERITTDLIQFADKLMVIQAENNSIGTPLTDMLKKSLTDRGYGRLVSVIKEFVTSNSEKVRLVAQTQVALEQHQIKLLEDDALLLQLGAYAAEYNAKTGNVSYNAPQGLNDDNVISCMLGYDAFKTASTFQIRTVRSLRNKQIAYNGKARKS